jgi:glyoxylase-like metal-dependent hydrolase (beta-lactamase superfamily II)/8-oxo-dGTP pyrophosphatase MutT (NUDIX family)
MRGAGATLETYWVKRGDVVSFMPGFHAFPGGTVGPSDVEFPVAGAHDERERALRACAVRELFEEIGVLLARPGARDQERIEGARERLLTGERTFAQLADEHRWRVHAEDLAFAGRWQTPPFSIARYDTTYYLARVPAGPEPVIEDRELASGEWITPARAVERWRDGEVALAPPVLHILEELARGEEGLPERLASAPDRAGRPILRIEFKWGIVLQPLRASALPPATHTNAYLVGEGEMALIDPGSGEPGELEALFALIEALAADGRRVSCVLLTHHHADHAGGVDAVRARLGVPVLAHAETARHVPVDRALADGETVHFAAARRAWSLRALHTPGHAAGHFCFLEERTRSLFSGDHVLGGSTVVIDPPEGDMTAYMASLERLAALDAEMLFPGHGSPQGAARRRIRALLRHRREREGRVLRALADGPRGVAELVEVVYADVTRDLWPWAERSLLAHLLKLEAEGRAARDGERWRPT